MLKSFFHIVHINMFDTSHLHENTYQPLVSRGRRSEWSWPLWAGAGAHSGPQCRLPCHVERRRRSHGFRVARRHECQDGVALSEAVVVGGNLSGPAE